MEQHQRTVTCASTGNILGDHPEILFAAAAQLITTSGRAVAALTLLASSLEAQQGLDEGALRGVAATIRAISKLIDSELSEYSLEIAEIKSLA